MGTEPTLSCQCADRSKSCSIPALPKKKNWEWVSECSTLEHGSSCQVQCDSSPLKKCYSYGGSTEYTCDNGKVTEPNLLCWCEETGSLSTSSSSASTGESSSVSESQNENQLCPDNCNSRGTCITRQNGASFCQCNTSFSGESCNNLFVQLHIEGIDYLQFKPKIAQVMRHAIVVDLRVEGGAYALPALKSYITSAALLQALFRSGISVSIFSVHIGEPRNPAWRPIGTPDCVDSDCNATRTMGRMYTNTEDTFNITSDMATEDARESSTNYLRKRKSSKVPKIGGNLKPTEEKNLEEQILHSPLDDDVST